MNSNICLTVLAVVMCLTCLPACDKKQAEPGGNVQSHVAGQSTARNHMEEDAPSSNSGNYAVIVPDIDDASYISDSIKILSQWRQVGINTKDESNQEKFYWVIRHMVDSGKDYSEAIDILKEIAMYHNNPGIRVGAVIAIFRNDNKKSMPFLKKLLIIEAGKHEITEGSIYVTSVCGGILSNNGEYEFAFPYMMKACTFDVAIERKDRRAIPDMRKALSNPLDKVRVKAAYGLVDLNDSREEVLMTLLDFLGRSQDKALDYRSGISADRASAVWMLARLKDRRAIPVLEDALNYEDRIGRDEINKAISIINGDIKDKTD